jgi:hypothetical protein
VFYTRRSLTSVSAADERRWVGSFIRVIRAIRGQFPGKSWWEPPRMAQMAWMGKMAWDPKPVFTKRTQMLKTASAAIAVACDKKPGFGV